MLVSVKCARNKYSRKFILILEITPSREYLLGLAKLIPSRFHMPQESLPDLVYKLLTNEISKVASDLDILFRTDR